jgi:class 3 adenylate cyclase/tetratricopeptide (TPR) repeat protein
MIGGPRTAPRAGDTSRNPGKLCGISQAPTRQRSNSFAKREAKAAVSLLTIVFTDVVGSSATKRDVSLGRDSRERDHAYLEKVQTRHFSLIRECYRAHGGREVSTMGDAFYLTFDDPVEAVRCAVRVQQRLLAEPIVTPLGPLCIRVGIHSGFPESFEGSWHGTDVDTAARVESVAAGGQILVSVRTYELVQHMTDVKFHSRGEFALKGVGRMGLWEADWDGKGPRATAVPPLWMKAREKRKRLALGAAIAIVLTVASFAFRVYSVRKAGQMPGQAASANARRSVAVLGFKNLGKPDADWISKALSEFFTSELAANGRARTIPGENVAHAKIDLSLPDADSYGADTLTRIRKLLGADDVILGSYLELGGQAGGQLRVDLRAQDTIACETVCSVTEIGAEGNLFELVAKAGTDLRQRLGIGEISKEQEASARATLPSNSEAVRLYAEGRKKLDMFDALGARADLEKAVAAEPGFALAHSALSAAWGQLGYNQKSREEAKRASELSSGLSREDQLSILGRYETVTSDWSKAIETYRTLWSFFPDNLEYGLRLAGAQSSGGKNQDALDAIETLRKLPAPQRDDARLDLAESDAAGGLSDVKRQLQAAERATTKAQMVGARIFAARGVINQARALDNLGEPAKSVAAYEQARQMAIAAGDSGQEAQALSGACIVVEEEGDYARARKMCEDSLAIRRKIGNEKGVALDLNEIAIMMRHQGDPEGAKKILEEALQIFRKIDDKFNAGVELGNIGNVLRDQGDLAGANRKYEETLPLFRATGNKGAQAISISNIANNLAQQGDLAGALQKFDEALEIDRAIGFKYNSTYVLVASGDALRMAGNLAQAKARCNEGLTLAKATSHKTFTADAFSCLGSVMLSEGDLAGARENEMQALAIRTEVGEKGETAVTRVAIAQLSVEEGHAADALAAIREAREEFRSEKKPAYELMATTALADALVEDGKSEEARKEIEAARQLVAKCEDRGSRFEFAIAAAKAQSAAGKASSRAEARKSLEATLSEATRTGFQAVQFEARLALGEAELESGDKSAGRRRLAALQKDATAKGFLQIARKAKAMAGRS